MGEDYIWPELATNGARIGTQAMLDAMAGAVISPHPFTAAVLGAAAILEIIHPDAEVPESAGAYGTITSAYLVGKEASKTAGLPDQLHFKVTGDPVDTAQLVGDVGLILKDIGAPTVIGMMAFDEIFSAFQEGIAGFSGGPVNAPLGHVGAYAVVGMKALLKNNGDVAKTMDQIVEDRKAISLDPEVALLSINTICRKAHELHSGAVTRMLIDATEPARALAVHRRAEYTYDQLKAGTPLEDIVRYFDCERIERAQNNGGKLFSAMTGEKVTIQIKKLEGGARRQSKLANKYWSFDPNVDVIVTMGDKVAEMKGFVHDLIVRATLKGECQDVAWAIPFAAAIVSELALNACSSLNMVVPAGMASVLKIDTPEEVANIVENAAFLSRAIPGGKASCQRVGKLALRIAGYQE